MLSKNVTIRLNLREVLFRTIVIHGFPIISKLKMIIKLLYNALEYAKISKIYTFEVFKLINILLISQN